MHIAQRFNQIRAAVVSFQLTNFELFVFMNCYKALLKENTVVLDFYLCINTLVMKTLEAN